MFIVCLSFSSLHWSSLFFFITPFPLCLFLSRILCGLAFFSFFSLYPLSDRTAAHKDVCFQEVDEDLICTMPRPGLAVTYSECCCHYGHGWGPECRTCPQRNSGELTVIPLKSHRGRSFPLRNAGTLTLVPLKSHSGCCFLLRNVGSLTLVPLRNSGKLKNSTNQYLWRVLFPTSKLCATSNTPHVLHGEHFPSEAS